MKQQSFAGIFGFRPTLHCYNYTNALVPATFTRDTVGRFLLSVPNHTLDMFKHAS